MTPNTRVVTVDRILCPTDFSDFSAAAVSYAAAMASDYGATVRLLHVSTPFPVVVPFADVPGDPRLFEVQSEQAEQGLAAEAARVRKSGVTVDTERREGNAVREVLNAAQDFKADVIVLGTHGRGGFERLVLGSVTEKILRKASCAVLTIPHASVGLDHGILRWRHILCAHDGSAASQAGVNFAASLAERSEARLTLLSVVESIPYGGDFTSPDFSAFRKARERHAKEALDAALTADARVRCHVSERVVYGKPSQQILEVAEQDTPDLIVMGVQGRGALDLLMFGSTTNHVVRHAACPVLTVRPPQPGA